MAKDIKCNPKSFYAYVRSKQKTKETIGPLVDGNGNKITEDEEVATTLNQYFTTVFTKENVTNLPTPKQMFTGDEEERLVDVEINEETVLHKLNRLRPDKAPGPDSLHPRILKELATVLAEPLNIIFNRSLEENEIPLDWKRANVAPIFKKGKRSQACNYRPISLTSQICKLFESIIKDEATIHLTKHQLINKTQHGFMSGRSCLTNLLEFLEDVTKVVDDGHPVDVIYLDFQKAFDKVPHK